MQCFPFFLHGYAPPSAPETNSQDTVLKARMGMCCGGTWDSSPPHRPLDHTLGTCPARVRPGLRRLRLHRAPKPSRAHVTVHVKPPYEVPKARQRDPRHNGRALLRYGGHPQTSREAEATQQRRVKSSLREPASRNTVSILKWNSVLFLVFSITRCGTSTATEF